MKTYRFSIWSRICIFFLFVLVLNIVSCDQIKNLFPGESQESPVVQTQWEDPEQENKTVPDPILSTKAPIPLKIKKIPGLEKNDQQYYYVQLGAFRNQNNAKNYIKNLREKNYKPNLYIQETKTKTWYTVRLGTHEKLAKAVEAGQRFSNSEKTEITVIYKNKVARLVRPVNTGKSKMISLKPDLKKVRNKKKIQEKTAKTKKEIKPEKKINHKLYSFQVGGLLNKKNALRQKKKFKLKGYNTFMAAVRDELNNEAWSTVQIGYYQTLLEAAKAARQFTIDEQLPTHARHIYDYHKHF